MSLDKTRWLSILIIAGALSVVLAAALPSEAQASGSGADSLTVVVLDEGESGSVFAAAWTDGQKCSFGYNVFLDGVEGSSVGLPEGATVDDSGRIHMASAGLIGGSGYGLVFSHPRSSGCLGFDRFPILRKRRLGSVWSPQWTMLRWTRIPAGRCRGAYSSAPSVTGLQGGDISGAIRGDASDNSGPGGYGPQRKHLSAAWS